MKKKALSVILALSLATALTSLPSDAFAKRMGGGSSFGGHPSFNAPAPRPMPSQRPFTQQSPVQRPPMAGGAPQRNSGMLGGFGGGMLGGLLAGSLLGSLFGGSAGAGAAGAAGTGGGIGFLDILLIFAGIWLLMRFLKKKKAAEQGPSYAGNAPFNGNAAQSGQNQPPFTGQSQYAGTGMQQGQQAGWVQHNTTGNPEIPDGFNTEEFLRGAKMAYTRMQAAWDRRDLSTIAQFATPAVMQVLEKQRQEDPQPSQTQIILINAQLQSVEEFGDKDRASVYFDVVMREDPNQEQPIHAQEMWTFIRLHNVGNWQLDGIQQIA